MKNLQLFFYKLGEFCLFLPDLEAVKMRSLFLAVLRIYDNLNKYSQIWQ